MTKHKLFNVPVEQIAAILIDGTWNAVTDFRIHGGACVNDWIFIGTPPGYSRLTITGSVEAISAVRFRHVPTPGLRIDGQLYEKVQS